MPALKPTSFGGEVVWLGLVPDRDASLRSKVIEKIEATFDGLIGEAHGGAVRLSCSRVAAQHPRGTPIRNVRQISLVSAEELAVIASKMGLAEIDPSWLGAQIVLRGLSDLTHLPPSSRLQGPAGTTLVVDMDNRPCQLPAREVEAVRPGHGRTFKASAEDRRGVTAWVEREGPLALGDRLTLHIPDQPPWSYLAEARDE